MKKIVKKMLILLIIVFIISSFLSVKAYATNGTGWNVGNMIKNRLMNVGSGVNTSGRFARVFVTVIRVIEVAASFFCVARLTFVGIRYFTASAYQKGEIKNGELLTSIIMIVGVFGASVIIEILYRVFIY